MGDALREQVRLARDERRARAARMTPFGGRATIGATVSSTGRGNRGSGDAASFSSFSSASPSLASSVVVGSLLGGSPGLTGVGGGAGEWARRRRCR